MGDNSVLKIDNLKIELIHKNQKLIAVKDVSFDLDPGKTIGIIGESGSGKSITCSAILGLLEDKKWIINGDIYFGETPIPYRSNKDMNKFRGKHIALITQNPMSAFDPLRTIRYHFIETLTTHKNMSKKDIEKKAIYILNKMKIQNPKNVLDCYSFELSGGMLQRIMIAIAIALEPEVLIADEPTTALDLTVQYEIIKILSKMQKDLGTSIILVSHDLGVISELADEVLVMYGGSIVEKAPLNEIMTSPKHPYTKGLISSRPNFSKERLAILEGTPPNLFERIGGCEFYNRCNIKNEKCIDNMISSIKVSQNHEVRCIHFEEGAYSCGTA
ncbi:ABC transporter ATP-binding protein [Paraclostridium sordellii]|uniref:ABC transporter ATP-binding protein n=1 Tax=Paraclostridium sordellii TaxID=1505 RepID=UPI0022E491EC|nr:ABC transporter ATP-binding protein [Paeniclostridium sordellii]